MTADRISSIYVGIYFILATALAIAGLLVISPLITSPTFLADSSASGGTLATAFLLIVLMAGSCVAIAVSAYPILKRANDTLAVGYVAVRTIEGTLFLVAATLWLVLMPLSEQFLAAGDPAGSHFQTLGDLAIYLSESIFTVGAELVFGISAVMFNAVLIKPRLVPLWISVWGLVGGILLLISGVLNMFGISLAVLELVLTVPIAVNEMVLALWLIFRGFDVAAIVPRPANG